MRKMECSWRTVADRDSDSFGMAPTDEPKSGDLQDGMLAYYLSQAGQSDVNVECRIDSEPFDFRDSMTTPPAKQ